MSFGVSLSAEYEDGFRLVEDESDQSPYDEGRNIFHAIVNGRAVPEHGRMVRFSATTATERRDIDWRPLWDVKDAQPIYSREMHRDWELDNTDDHVLTDSGPICDSHTFGFQYIDETGEPVREVQVFTCPVLTPSRYLFGAIRYWAAQRLRSFSRASGSPSPLSPRPSR